MIIQVYLIPILEFAGLFGFLYCAYLLGQRLLSHRGWFAQSGLGALTLFAIQSLIQTAWLYSGATLGQTSDIASLLFTLGIGGACIVACKGPRNEKTEKEIWTRSRIIHAALLGAISLGSFFLMLIGATRAATVDSIRTPWPLLPAGTLAIIACSWLVIALGHRLVKSSTFSAFQAALALATCSFITPILYRLGFGFDGFLHVATEHIILNTGTLHPKPLYYIGQYVFTTWISRSFLVPIEIVDRWLVPLATVILIPFALHVSRPKKELGAFFLFLLPLASFVATTPQSFAYVIGFVALLLATSAESPINPIAPLALGAWAVAIHPLAGIPLFFLVIGLLFLRESARWTFARQSFAWLCAIASAISVPILFFVLSLKGSTPIIWNAQSLLSIRPWNDLLHSLLPWIGNRFVVWPAWSSVVAQTVPVLFIISAVVGLRLTTGTPRQHIKLLLGAGILLFIASTLIKSAGDFAFLIDYERGNYADRLSLLALFCLLPAALPALSALLKKAQTNPLLLGSGFFLFATAGAAGLVYNALPRNDALITGHGWSVGQADIQAVRFIDQDANMQPYTVLANQSVSAAAVSQLGFKRYNGDTFFYPIPTGGKLYDVFLRATYQEPSLETMKDAGALGGTSLVYVVLNDYWWNADQVRTSLSAIANSEQTFGDPMLGIGHAASVYKFDLNTPKKASPTTDGS